MERIPDNYLSDIFNGAFNIKSMIFAMTQEGLALGTSSGSYVKD